MDENPGVPPATPPPTQPAAPPDEGGVAPVDRAPTWRRQPYRLFFFFGLLHVWVGVIPWLAVALGVPGHNTQVFHSIAQVQGFLICFALGFLFTMIPRRTRTEAPSALQMILGLACPVGISVCAAFEWLAASQTFWFVLVATLAQFVVSRFLRSEPGRGPLPAFVWMPIAFGFGVVGAILFGVYGALGPTYFRVHELAQLFLLQGMFLGLVVGVGSMVFPLFTRGESPGSSPAGAPRWVHVLAALALVGTFFLEVFGDRPTGFLSRAVLCGGLLVWSGRIHRFPTLGGANRWVVWGAAWMVPVGYAVAGLAPQTQVQAGLHFVFIGCFATLSFAVGLHVSLAHAGQKGRLAGWSWRFVAWPALFAVALGARCLMQFDPGDRYLIWLGTAAGSFLAGTLVWASLVLPAVIRPAS